MELGQYIKSRRQNIGLTQKELAKLVGVNQDAISQYENGNREPGWRVFLRLCYALGMRANDFIDFENSQFVYKDETGKVHELKFECEEPKAGKITVGKIDLRVAGYYGKRSGENETKQ